VKTARLLQRTGLSKVRWVLPLGASLLLWMVASGISGRISLNLLFVNITLASFVALVAVGQMLVVAAGDGSFDLSIPYVMTLAAYISGVASGGTNSHLLLAILAGLGVGLAAGAFNGLLVVGPGLPPIVATLATGYIAYTIVLLKGNGSQVIVAPRIISFGQQSWHGLTLVVLAAVIVLAAVALLRGQGRYGMYLHAVGQSRPAAALAGIPVRRVVVLTFGLSAVLAAIAGILLSGYAGGAFANMGDPYLIASVAAIVVGGTSVRGGESAIAATVFGATTISLLTAVLELSGAAPGIQDMVEGAVIIGVVIVVTRAQRERGSREAGA
jgi:ribose transport system permease protein